MTTQQELKLFRALRLLLRLVCIIAYNQIWYLRGKDAIAPATSTAQMELEQEAGNFAKHEL